MDTKFARYLAEIWKIYESFWDPSIFLNANPLKIMQDRLSGNPQIGQIFAGYRSTGNP